MTAPAQEPICLNFGANFKSLSDRIGIERDRRLDAANRVIGFGVHCLDVLQGGIGHDDLILIGAKPGVGKTELSTLIARANATASRKRRVHYFALEAAELEIERRIKYKLIADMVFNDKTRPKEHYLRMNYLDWHYGRLEDITARLEPIADSALAQEYPSLFVLYRDRDFNVDTLERSMLAIQDQTDLIILDHLHYVDSDDPSENRGYKVIVKRIRDVALTIGKPVVVIAHVRKGERKGGPLVPTLEDFHGTSDIPKIATKAIMLARAWDYPTGKPYLLNTYLAPLKNRLDGSRTQYCALVQFDMRMGAYSREFSLGKLTSNCESFELIPDNELPYWVTHPYKMQRDQP